MGNAERREPTIAQILKEKDLKPMIRQSREALLFCCYGFRTNVSVCSVWTCYASIADVLVALDIEKQEINICTRCLSPVSSDGLCRLFSVMLVRNGQLLATFSATSSQHAAAVLSCHSLAEAVLVNATAVVRLKCSFHFALFIFYCYYLFMNSVAL